MQKFLDAMAAFFGVVVRGQTYLNLFFLLLAMPLGILYFTVLITGMTVGLATLIVWVGLLVLGLTYALWWGFIAFERQTVVWLLREEVAPMQRRDTSGLSAWKKFTATLANPVTWKGLAYLLIKLPLGVLSFALLVSLLSVSLSLLAAPFYYQFANAQVDLGFWQPTWLIDTLPEALVICVAGFFALLVSLHILNGLAWVSGKFGKAMLGDSEPAVLTVPVTAAASAPVAAAASVPVAAAASAPVAAVAAVPAVEAVAAEPSFPAVEPAPAVPAEPVAGDVAPEEPTI